MLKGPATVADDARMKRRLVAFGLATAIVLPAATGGAQAARKVGSPLPPATGNTACKTQPPVLLAVGARPRSALRLSLAANANRSGTQFDTERVHATTFAPDGSTVPRDSTEQRKGVYTTGRPAHGHLPVTLRLSIPGATGKASKLNELRLVGFLDALNGGSLKAVNAGRNALLNDHLPNEPIGIGASWRVVNCDQVDSTPARETRTYTLRSVAHGVVIASYRDVVEIDPAHVDLGSDTTAAGVVHYRLVSLRGTATGTMHLPLANALAGTWSTKTTAKVVFNATPANAASIAIHTSFVDNETVGPTR
jgi:hypothetical protein